MSRDDDNNPLTSRLGILVGSIRGPESVLGIGGGGGVSIFWIGQQSRKRQHSEEYFNVTAVRLATGLAGKCTSFAFPTSHNGRHSLTVRSGDWVITNTHAESGKSSTERDARTQQLRHLSRGHEYDTDKIHILLGDLNARPGEDQCLLAEGWRDVWTASPASDDWTWRVGVNQARYDRVYVHNSIDARVRCTVIERLPGVWGRMTDHVALHTVVRRTELHAVVPPFPGLCAEPHERTAKTVTTEADGVASRGAEETQRQQYSAPIQAEESHDSFQLRPDTPVVSIATKVEAEILGFQKMLRLWDEDPVTREDVEQQILTDWKEVPVACGFRVAHPQDNGVRRWATPADKLAQQQKYAKCLAWAFECGLTDAEFKANLAAVPTKSNQRGVTALPAYMRSPNCSSWEHARRLCVSVSIRTVATNAGRRLGGEAVATQAAEEVSALLSSEPHRRSKLSLMPQSWRDDKTLRVPDGSQSLSSGIKSLPGFFGMWLRDQGAALMGRRAEENWRDSRYRQPEGLSQRCADDQQQSQTGERAPPHFELDGETCKKTWQRFDSQHAVATAWHDFLWRTTCDEVCAVASNRNHKRNRKIGSVWESEMIHKCTGAYRNHK